MPKNSKKKFIVIKSDFILEHDIEDSFYLSIIGSWSNLIGVFDDFSSAYDSLSSSAHKTYSENINRFDPEGTPDFRYLYDNYSILRDHDRLGSVEFEIFEIDLFENSNFIFFINTSNSKKLMTFPKKVYSLQSSSSEVDSKILELKKDFLFEHNLEEEDISISRLFSF